jgi:DNA-binding MarR family transcriptional regulator
MGLASGREVVYTTLMRVEHLARTIAHQCLVMRARRVSRVLTRIYDEELRPHGIVTAQLNLLVALGASGGLRPSQLAAALEIEKSTLSRTLPRLAEQGFIAVEREPSGGQRLTLTSAGEALLRAARPAWERAQARAKDVLDRDLVAVLRDLPA